MAKIIGIDVAGYQSESLARYVNAGAKYVIVKATEGNWYFNPIAVEQIKSAHAHHIYVHAYHYAEFSNSVSKAKQEAKYFLARCKTLGISKKRWLWLDWESGSGNYVYGDKSANTRAILAFMETCSAAGYHVGLYAGASILRNNVDTSKVIHKFGNCLWVASYAVSGRIDNPNFNYFPSMDGVAIWQFTEDWRGLKVDGNVMLIDLHAEKKTSQQIKPKSAVKPIEKIPKTVFIPIIDNNPNYKVRLLSSAGHYQDQYILTNSNWKVWGVKIIKGMKCYKIGTEKQYVPAKFCKIK